ncbi:ABC transporter permease [Mechercharimyces sp. CAU 1602]|uniref:ABC transporter permease n=1 Tax=Mechercharimyces sp. CAU 1602 TaxID=2973933 RepID=UPI002161EB13|nr:ABC transporter permease [Mechercharimyces sp. CAU 1602]MCS1351057.1 ABC transporter permease [Mechercharimyces sp. CAU 1602]
MSLFFHELKSKWKALFFWCLGASALVVSGMSEYSGLQGTGESMNELIAQMPESLQAILGTGTLDLSTATGYFGMLFSYLILITTIHAVLLGTSTIVKEERERTAEFLMVKPISRSRVLTHKLLAAGCNLLLLNGASTITAVISISVFATEGESSKHVVMLMIGMLLTQLIFFTLGITIATWGKWLKRSTIIGATLLLICYLLSIAIDLNPSFEALSYVTPFKYFEAKVILNEGSLDPLFLTISFIVIVLSILGSYSLYKRRDLQI